MPNTATAYKRLRQAKKRTARNRAIKSKVKTSIRRFSEALERADEQTAEARLQEAIREIDKAVSKGIIHKNSGARKKSSLHRAFNSFQQKAG